MNQISTLHLDREVEDLMFNFCRAFTQKERLVTGVHLYEDAIKQLKRNGESVDNHERLLEETRIKLEKWKLILDKIKKELELQAVLMATSLYREKADFEDPKTESYKLELLEKGYLYGI